MKQKFLFLGLLLITLTACGLREREMQLEKRISEMDQKEQELLLKEKALQLKEEELQQKEKLLDSTNKLAIDSLHILHPELPGTWNATMRCTETTCPGSAVGDTRNEQWEISYQDNTVIVKALSDNKVVRIYSGTYTGNSIELSTQPDIAGSEQKTKMIVRLQATRETEMVGQREIIRPEDCRIVYSLELKKQ